MLITFILICQPNLQNFCDVIIVFSQAQPSPDSPRDDGRERAFLPAYHPTHLSLHQMRKTLSTSGPLRLLLDALVVSIRGYTDCLFTRIPFSEDKKASSRRPQDDNHIINISPPPSGRSLTAKNLYRIFYSFHGGGEEGENLL